MRKTVRLAAGVAATMMLGGCAFMGEKPPSCDGPVRPINPPQYYVNGGPPKPAVDVQAPPAETTNATRNDDGHE